jgi:hypothetical protein
MRPCARRLFATSAVAGPGLVLPVTEPVRPGQDVLDTDGRVEREGGEEAADLVARQRDQAPSAGSRSPFSTGYSCSVARVAAAASMARVMWAYRAALAQKALVGLEGVAATREEPTELPAEVILDELVGKVRRPFGRVGFPKSDRLPVARAGGTRFACHETRKRMGQGRTNGLFGTNGRVADARAAEAERAVQAVTVETRDQLGKRIDQAQADIDLAVKDAQQQASEAADSARSKWAQM